MELKDFQQEVLDTLDGYLDALVEQQLRAAEIEKLNREKPDLNIPVPDYTEEAWKALKELGKLRKARANVPFSPRKDGAGRPVPSVTLKIPTGGGKTLLAAQAVSRIMGKWAYRYRLFSLTTFCASTPRTKSLHRWSPIQMV